MLVSGVQLPSEPFLNMGQIEIAIQILEDYYKNRERTTLNSMRGIEDPFKILISCLISLRVKDEITDKIVEELFKHISSPEEIINMSLAKLEKIIFSSGYYKVKAKTLKHVSHEIKERFHNKVPETKEELLSIKGIGPKTANVVLNFAFNKEVIPVDVNVHRISNRLGWVKEKTAEKTEKSLELVLPRKYWKEINALFILHGKTICLPISPYCSKCPVNMLCPKIGVKKSR